MKQKARSSRDRIGLRKGPGTQCWLGLQQRLVNPLLISHARGEVVAVPLPASRTFVENRDVVKLLS